MRRALVLMIAAAGCSSSSGSIALADLGAKVLDTECSFAARCREYPDVATCKANAQVDLVQIQADVTAGKIVYDGSKAASCLDAMDAADCSRSGGDVTVCDQVFTGTVATGGTCFINEDCASASCNTSACGAAACCAGTCAGSPVPIAHGGDCSGEGSQCVATDYCKYDFDSSPITATCATILVAGSSCTPYDECASGHYCSGSDTAAGTCVKLAPTGATCSATAWTACDLDYDYCDATTSKCTDLIAVGGACTSDTQYDCVNYAFCDTATGKCVARPALGATCVAGADNCLGDTQCDTTSLKCTLPAPPTACP